MSRLYAIIQNNVVSNIQLLSENDLSDILRISQNAIDIQDFIIQPQIGWILQGNLLVPSYAQSQDLLSMIESKIEYYQKVAPKLLTKLYATNTLNGMTLSHSDEMFDNYADVVFRLKEGAFPTAIYRLQQKVPSGNVTQEIINSWISLVQEQLV